MVEYFRLEHFSFWTKRRVFLLLIFATSVFILIGLFLPLINNNDSDLQSPFTSGRGLLSFWARKASPLSPDTKVLLYWTPFMGDLEEVIQCGEEATCLVTDNRKYRNSSQLQAFLFYGSHFDPTDLPIPRRDKDLWALYHEESPKNFPLLSFNNTIRLFNFTSTFSRYSHIPLTLQHLSDLSDIFDVKYHQALKFKNRAQKTLNLAPVLYLQSICDTLSERDQYVSELKKYINIDCYGRCLQNQALPDYLTINYLENLESGELMRFIARYKFMITIENAVCDDYISEKLWRALKAGVVPIYYGSPKIRDWLPYPKAAILVDDFSSPKALAGFIKKLNKNDAMYMEYQAHKASKPPPVTNNYLLHRVYKYHFISRDHLRDFECAVCTLKNHSVIASSKDYNCYLRFPKGIKSKSRGLKEYYLHGRCEAAVLLKLLAKNKNYTKEEYEKQKEVIYKEDLC